MKSSITVVMAVMAGSAALNLSLAAEPFQRLSGPQIRAKLIGMQFTDEVHWGEVYWPDGRVTSEEMSRKRLGTWRIEKNLLCVDYGADGGSNCYEVRLSGRRVEMRTLDSVDSPMEGVLERAPKHR